ncbi:hypothetical protein [Rhizomicrobium electricum]|uniref:Uncharacterized protein n=1 Tax=Rhizomicrobium electricum TaxID=480070 RepID=A0ABP3QAE8_9PROT|nr:hypothetical protein [Rhizomicrobium electricum]NIJ50552.1 hypothetical protein [Rhizomicrobium electricum]
MPDGSALKAGKSKLAIRLFLCVVVGVGSGLPSVQSASASTAKKGPNTTEAWRDYLFYRCVHEYFSGGELDKLDSSVGLAIEYVSLDPAALEAVVGKAKEVAKRLRAPRPPGTQVSEGTEGKVAVLAVCLDEARAFKLPRK